MQNIKVGFSASKKVGNSVKRHRAQRLMREAVRPCVPKMTANHNYIFVAKEGCAEKTLAEVSACVVAVLKKATLLRAE